ncbi:putative aminopeptidase npepl1 [Physocladia obscura]|uniref:Aminopeptidase npepl1 n=1 Tax=Physocladia obscura TaxID=109957 RepID=A0AAD5TBF1_9FUNG|nr:putative aminopeptidase npepl1 [Physocladia obscura]
MSSVIVKQVCESLDSLVLVKEGATETQTKRTLLVVATKKKYETISLEKLPGVDVPLVEAVRAGYTELATAHSANGVAVSLAVLPTKASRTFGPIRSDLLHSIVSANLVAANKDSDADIVVLLDSPEQIIAATLAVARAFPLYYNKLKPQRARSIFFHVISSPNSDGSNVANTATLQILVDSCRAAARLVDTPPNELNPTTYVQTVRDIHSSLLRPANVVLDIIQGTELRDREYGGIWNVGKASQNLPALVVLSYSPPFPTKSEKSVAWVGKGITYDTGGLSIKSKEGMPTMVCEQSKV